MVQVMGKDVSMLNLALGVAGGIILSKVVATGVRSIRATTLGITTGPGAPWDLTANVPPDMRVGFPGRVSHPGVRFVGRPF